MISSYAVFGLVQRVMFRQTFIRGLIKRGLKGGATNDHRDASRVTLTIEGPREQAQELVEELAKIAPLNSWGAKVDRWEELTDSIEIHKHQVTTENVDQFNWSDGVEFYF